MKRNVPDFMSNWTERMLTHIKARKWSEKDMEDSWYDVCKSWGDKYKWDNVINLAYRLHVSDATYTRLSKITAEWVVSKN